MTRPRVTVACTFFLVVLAGTVLRMRHVDQARGAEAEALPGIELPTGGHPEPAGGFAAIDLGGVHSPGDQYLDANRPGMTGGEAHRLDSLFAERHRAQSN